MEIINDVWVVSELLCHLVEQHSLILQGAGVGWHEEYMQTCLESVKSCMWVGCMELSVIFKTGTLYLILRTLDQIHGLEVKTMCFKEITYQTVKTVWVCVSLSKESVYSWVHVWSIVPPAPHAPVPPLGRTACLTASPPVCHSPPTNPTNRRPLPQNYMIASAYQKILHSAHTCTLGHRLLHKLDVCLPPCTSCYNVHNPVCLNHHDI